MLFSNSYSMDILFIIVVLYNCSGLGCEPFNVWHTTLARKKINFPSLLSDKKNVWEQIKAKSIRNNTILPFLIYQQMQKDKNYF
jgi:hypothetical protein